MDKNRLRKRKNHVQYLQWKEAMNEYLLYKQAQGLRESTIKGQQDVISLFFKRYPEAWPDNLKQCLLSFLGENVKAATYNLRVSYLRSFFDWCIKENLIQEKVNPAAEFKRRKADSRIVQLDEDTLIKLINLPDRTTFAGLRDYALILLSLDTGIRPKEALSLTIDDINYRALEVYIRSEIAKTKVSRTLPILPVTANAIRDLIKSRHPAWDDSLPVFCSADGTPMTRHTWGDRLEMYGKQLGVKIRSYDLRHTFALHFLRNGGHALALQRMMGHKDLAMTKRYVSLTEQDLQDQHNLASPLGKLVPQKNRVRKLKKD